MGLFIICGHKKGEKFAIRIINGHPEWAERFEQHKGTNIINGRVSMWSEAYVFASLKGEINKDFLYWHIVPSINVRMLEWRNFQVYGEFSIIRTLVGRKAYDAWQVAKKQGR